jgi:hypothetical protein
VSLNKEVLLLSVVCRYHSSVGNRDEMQNKTDIKRGKEGADKEV